MRRVFASAASAPAYSYDPYGNALQGTAPLTDFNYAGMFYNVDSGLYLTQYRAYDPVSGRWLSRDRLGEMDALNTSGKFVSVANAIGPAPLREDNNGTVQASNPIPNLTDAINLYIYAASAPSIYIDPNGTFIVYGFGGAAGISGAGGIFTTGTGYDFSSGTWNSFVSPGWGVGFDFGAGGGVGFFTGDWSDFEGEAWSVNGSVFGWGISVTLGQNGAWGISGGWTRGVPSFPGGVSATHTNTHLGFPPCP